MSTRSKEVMSESKGTGFSLVFRLGESKSARVSMSASKSKAKSLAGTLIASKAAESVLGDRATLSHDPILSRLYVVDGGDFAHTQEYLERLESDGEVELVYVAPQRDVLANRFTQSSRSQVLDDSWHEQVKLAAARKLAQWKPTERISVAVVDSGIDPNHPQLAHIEFIDHLKKSPRRPDATGHGTHVAGLIAAAPCTENTFRGIATDCVDVVAHRGLVRPHRAAAYYRALRAAARARIVNLSVGGEGEDPIETELIQDCLNAGGIVVAAMGNARDLGNPTMYPAVLEEVIAVGAVDARGNVAEFSNYGEHILLAAPGVDIRSTVPTYRVADFPGEGTPPLGGQSGTSMATPIVSAILARMLAYRPQLTRSQVIDLIKTRLGAAWDQDIGHGIVDAFALLAAL